MVKALVTGGTGFVGSHIVRQLNAAGHDVRVLHRQTSKLDALHGLAYETTIGTLGDFDALRRACEGVEWVFHVAAVADYWRAEQRRLYQVNVGGTQQMLRAARAAEVKRVVFTSSAAAVGLRDDRPADENATFNLPPQAFPYGYSKYLAEEVVRDFVAEGLDAVIVNPTVIMGPGDLNMISGSFIKQIKRLGRWVPVTSGGIAVVDVRDVARWHVEAAQKGTTGERYILSAANYSYQAWYGMIADVVGVEAPTLTVPDFVAPLTARLIELARRLGLPTPVDATQTRMGIRKVYFDASKAWAVFSPPQIDMRRSLDETYQWYRSHGYL